MKRFYVYFGVLAVSAFVLGCSPISDVEADAYEQDDTISAAHEFVFPMLIEKHNFYDDPVDWYAFTNTTSSGNIVICTYRVANMDADTVIFVYGDGDFDLCLASNDNYTTTNTNETYDSLVVVSNAVYGQRYFFCVQSADWSYGSRKNYNVSVYEQ